MTLQCKTYTVIFGIFKQHTKAKWVPQILQQANWCWHGALCTTPGRFVLTQGQAKGKAT